MLGFLCRLGHVATTAELNRSYRDTGFVDFIRRHPDVDRVRRGVYACAHLGELPRLALAVGGRFDCITVLHHQGLLPDDQYDPAIPHLRLVAGSGRAAADRRGFDGAFTAHWSALRFSGMERAHPAAYKLAVPVPEALRQSMSCLAGDQLVHAIQTALLTKLITRADATRLLALAPARLATVLRVVDLTQARR